MRTPPTIFWMASLADVLLPTEPTPTPATLIYLATSEMTTGFMYLQSVKSGVLAMIGGEESGLAQAYWAALDGAIANLAEATRELQFDFIAAPPSTRADLYMPYMRRIVEVHPSATDLSQSLTRAGDVRSGTARSTSALAERLTFNAPQLALPDRPSTLLIVDDVYAGGHTAAAITQMISSWLGTPAAITVASPLWVTGRL